MHEQGDPELQQVIQRSIAELSAAVIPRVPIVGVPEPKRPDMPDSRGEQGQREREPLPDYAIQAMEAICRFFWEAIGERCERLGMDRGKEWRARELLSRYGLIALAVKIGRIEFFGPTKKGLAWAKKKRIPWPRFKSGLAHEIVIRRLRINIVAAKLRASFRVSGTYDGVQGDLAILLPGGFVIVCQVSNTNSVKNELDCLLRLAGVEEVEAVLMVTLKKTKAQRMKTRLADLAQPAIWAAGQTDRSEEQGEAGEAMPDAGERTTRELLKKIRIYDAAEVLNRKFDWRALFTELGALEEDQEDE